MEIKIKFLILSFLLLFLFGCKEEPIYLYEVNNVNVEQANSDKNTVKTTEEFISIAYSDLFGTSIDNAELGKLNTCYSAFGDKKLIEDMIIRDFLNDPTVLIPSETEMREDVSKFVKESYEKLFNREPNEFESWQIVNIIDSDTMVTPELLYYAILTSDEYRYY